MSQFYGIKNWLEAFIYRFFEKYVSKKFQKERILSRFFSLKKYQNLNGCQEFF